MKEKLPTPDKIKEEKERIKEEVQAFKERTEGLNPEMFGVPGEESLAEEKVPEEMIFAYELEEKIAEYTKRAELIKDKTFNQIELDLSEGQTVLRNAWNAIRGLSYLIHSPLWSEISKEKREKVIEKAKLVKENALEAIELYLSNSKRPDSAWFAVIGLSALTTSPLWPEISKKKQKELVEKTKLTKGHVLKKIESNLNRGKRYSVFALNAIWGLHYLINSPLWSEVDKEQQEELIKKFGLVKDNALKEIESYLAQSQANQGSAWLATLSLSSLITLKNYLLKVANQKMRKQEHQKALHPEKEIPPRPEFPTF